MADSGFLNRISQFTDKERIAFRKKALIFSFFLVLSVIFWFMNALSKNYTTDIKYPVRYRNFPNDKTLIGELPNYFTIRVNAHGYTLLRHKLSSRYIPIVFSVNSFSLSQMPGRDSSFYFLETRYIREYVGKQLSSEFDIVSLKPDTIVFPFADVISRKIPVKSNLSFELGQQLILKDKLQISPDSLTVSGPDYIIDSLKYVYTEKKNLGVLKKSFNKTIGLQKLDHVLFDPDNVMVSFEMEKFTEKILRVPLEILNLPDSVNLKLFPHLIDVYCQVGLSNFQKLEPFMFKAIVNYNDIQTTQTEKLIINMQTVPDFVKSVNYSPKTVEYLIEE
jgi:hypothetical protein